MPKPSSSTSIVEKSSLTVTVIVFASASYALEINSLNALTNGLYMPDSSRMIPGSTPLSRIAVSPLRRRSHEGEPGANRRAARSWCASLAPCRPPKPLKVPVVDQSTSASGDRISDESFCIGGLLARKNSVMISPANMLRAVTPTPLTKKVRAWLIPGAWPDCRYGTSRNPSRSDTGRSGDSWELGPNGQRCSSSFVAV